MFVIIDSKYLSFLLECHEFCLSQEIQQLGIYKQIYTYVIYIHEYADGEKCKAKSDRDNICINKKLYIIQIHIYSSQTHFD